MNFIPNGSPEAFSLSAVLIAFILIDDTTAKEQNALGNWFMLLGQTLCTNSTHRQTLEERGNYTYSSTRTSQNGNTNIQSQITMLEKTVAAMQKQIQELNLQVNRHNI